MAKHKIGLVLSGGGARGIAHIGVIKALEELGITPQVISGTSAGAAIGAFYAAGFSISEIEKFVRENRFFHLSDVAWSSSGLLKTETNEKLFRNYFQKKTFEQLKIPLFISATDLLAGKTVYFSEGDVVMAILASSAIPLLFEPVEYQNKLFIDGGVISAFPSEPLLSICDKIVGVYVNPVSKISTIKGMMAVFDRGLHLTMYNNVEQKKSHCDLFIEPPELLKYSAFDYNQADELIGIGYRYTMTLREALKQLI
ncbi:MAG: patatin-like phospholipase family protein [bacterium]|nr:patatin-like phospholipase family protein [bacterium]